MDSNPNPIRPKGGNRDLLRYAGLATQLMALLAVTTWGGWELDKKVGIKALFVIVFPLLALTASLWQLVRSFKK